MSIILMEIWTRQHSAHRRSHGGAVGAPAPQGGEKIFWGVIYRENV